MPRLSIPTQYKTGLSKMNSIPDAVFNELISALRDFRSTSFDPSAVEKIAASTPNITSDDLDLMLETLLAMYLVRIGNEKSIEQFSQDVVKEMEASGPTSLKFLDNDQRQKLIGRLNALFSIESLSLIAKARDLQVEHGHVFLNARIITDLRPVFGLAANESPLGMVLFHTLKLSYVDRESHGERSTMYFALDESDIAVLRKLLDRADAKANVIRLSLQNAGITCFGEGQKG